MLVQDLQGVEQVEVSPPRRPGHAAAVTYSVRMGDERIVAPLAAFFPDLCGLAGRGLLQRADKWTSDPTDANDDDYLNTTMSRHEMVHDLPS